MADHNPGLVEGASDSTAIPASASPAPAAPLDPSRRTSLFCDDTASPPEPANIETRSSAAGPSNGTTHLHDSPAHIPLRPSLTAPAIPTIPRLATPPDLRTPMRPRIPRVEKDADDPTSRPETLYRGDTSTPTTLTRLFGVKAPEDTRRSPSFNAMTDLRPRISSAETSTLTGHLRTHGLLGGKYSDVTVYAFSTTYQLHRLLLARAPFFSTALSGEWIESTSREIVLHPSDVDASINRQSFELALKRLYGDPDEQAEAVNPAACFATGCWLEMTDLVESSIANMLRQMTPENLTPLIKLVTGNYYGRAGDKILASSKAMLCRHGWKMALRIWDDVPADIIREIVGGDGFYVSGEFDRWILATRILNRRLRKLAAEMGLFKPGETRSFDVPDSIKLMALRFDNVYRRNAVRTASSLPDDFSRWVSVYTNHDIEPLLVLLDEGIHYMHLPYEHLQYIRKSTDIFGLPVMPDKVVSDALWMQLELRQKVLNSAEDNLELGLSREAEEPQAQPLTAHESTMSMTREPGGEKGKQRDQSATSEADNISNSWDGNGKPRKFWIPSADCNIVMGGSSGPVVATSPTPSAVRHVARLSGNLQPEDVQWAADFGAAVADTRPIPGLEAQLAADMDAQPVSYSLYPPFRFATEFQNPRSLKGRKRFYSRTIFYAGSLWNIYIQRLRSSKLGVYLHRAKILEPDDTLVSSNGLGPRSVDERIGLLEREMLLRHDRVPSNRLQNTLQTVHGEHGHEDDSSGSGDADTSMLRSGGRQQAPHPSPIGRLNDIVYRKSRQLANASASPDSPQPLGRNRRASYSPAGGDQSYYETSDEEDSAEDPELIRLSAAPQVHTLPPYIDARPKIKTYFKIYSPSKGGRMLSVYESVPSNFNFSQSWGWKSSTLMLDEGFEGPIHVATLQDDGADEAVVDGMDREAEEAPRSSLSDGKLRFMVVIGNV